MFLGKRINFWISFKANFSRTKYSFFNDFSLVFGHFVYSSSILYVVRSFNTCPIGIISKENLVEVAVILVQNTTTIGKLIQF